MTALRWTLPLAAAATLAGCSTTIDDGKAEKLVTKAARATGAEVKGVSCPGGMTAKKGATFTCDVTGADGSTGKILIEEKDAKGNARIRSNLLQPAKVERLVGDTMRSQVTGRRVTSRCPDIVVARKGATFVCRVTGDDGTRGDVRGTGKDDVGNVTIDADFLHTGNAEREIARDIERKTGVDAVEVVCPAILLPKAGATFTCKASGGGQSATVVGTQTNDSGGFRYRATA